MSEKELELPVFFVIVIAIIIFFGGFLFIFYNLGQ